MVGAAAADGCRAIELFQQDDQGAFVLQREAGEFEQHVCCVAKFLGMAIGRADEECRGFDIAACFESGEPAGEAQPTK